MPRPRPPHLHREQTRHGGVAWYVRRKHSRRIRIKADYDTAEFWAQYRAALEGTPPPSKVAKTDTLAWALGRYRNSSAWAGFSTSTRRQRENIFKTVIKTAGMVPLKDIDSETIRAGRERRAATPHAANNFLKAMRGFFAWAGEVKMVDVDPTKGVKLLKGENDERGFHAWTEDELTRFEARWPVGTRERLAFDLLLYTGLRRGDAVKVGRQHVRDGVITLRTEKTGGEIFPPILPPLAASIAATKIGDLTYLVTNTGQPWVKESFGNWFREISRKASCPGSAHGLRKAGAVRAALNGATVNQLMAMYGWRTAKMALHYTEAADRKRLAQAGAPLLLTAHSENKNRPHLRSGTGASVKNRKNSGG
jgi:integrase